MPATLPSPSASTLQRSERLRAHIRAEILAAGGWLSFARYMELALYEPQLGYYMSGARKFGAGGDFITAPELSPLFGRALARQVGQILQLSQPHVLELGAGSGALAADLLLELERLAAPAHSYAILELSGHLRDLQRDTLRRRAPHLLDRVTWLDRLPESVSGAVIANEVFDALPVHIIAWRDDGIFERGVALDGTDFTWREQPARGALLAAARDIQSAHALPSPYISEISLAGDALMRSLSDILQIGCVYLLDYGYPTEEYYHQQRTSGTLVCHYQQRMHADPFHLPGGEDITAHVNFSALAESARERGVDLLGYASQAQFLIHCGITELLGEFDASDAATYLPHAASVQKLLSPAEMGELFKVLALGRGIGERLIGFSAR